MNGTEDGDHLDAATSTSLDKNGMDSIGTIVHSSTKEVGCQSSVIPEDLNTRLDASGADEEEQLSSNTTNRSDPILILASTTAATEMKETDEVAANPVLDSSPMEAGEGGTDVDGRTAFSTSATLPPIPTSPTQVMPVRTGKRPSPWREPRTTGQPPPPARETNHGSSSTTIKKTVTTNTNEDPVRQRKKEKRLKKKKQKRLEYLCSGSIFVDIPLSVTADLGIALRRGRQHRIRALHRHFPSLQQEQQQMEKATSAAGDRTEPTSDVGGFSTTEDVMNSKTDKTTAPKKILRHVPQPHEYANVIDYLEAKYVQGVVISDDLEDHDDEDGENVDDEEGEGSVYSETSFLDDTGLQRTIAEQVLGHTTTTKLELINNEDGGFFVNVGDLEIEETDLTQDLYDPIHDTNKDSMKRNKKSRKRKASVSDCDTAAGNVTPTGPTKGKNSPATTGKPVAKPSKIEAIPSPTTKSAKSIKAASIPASKKIKIEEKKPDLTVSASPKAKKGIDGKTEAVMHKNPVTLKLQKIANRKKDEIMEHYNKLKTIIENLTDEELPRKPKPKRTRVVVKVPSGNNPGDTITFANPHVPGQKLKVKVPANIKAGDTFKVTVPKPAEVDNDDDKLGEDGLARDHNKFNREFYDVLDDYAKAYDEWCDAEGAYRRAIDDKTFTSHFMKRNKCDDLVSLFPDDTKTSISIDYLKKVIRRARQNKHKRELTLAKQQISFIEEHQDLIEQNSDDEEAGSGGEDDHDEGNDDTPNNNASSSEDNDDDKHEKTAMHVSSKVSNTVKVAMTTKKGAKPTRTAFLPDFSNVFPSITLHLGDFVDGSQK